jgi:hypothetical protein
LRFEKTLMVALAVVVPLSVHAQERGEPGPSTAGVNESTSREAPNEGTDAALEAAAPAEARRLPFRGTTVSYGNVSTVGHVLNDSPRASYAYSMAYSFKPRYYLTDRISLRAGFELEQELTDSGATTYLREPLFSDITLGAYFSDILEPVTRLVDVGASLGLVFPTSKFSQAATLIMGVNAGLSAHKTFDVMSGLRVGYGFRVTKPFHSATAVELDSPVVACTPGSRIACDSLSYSFATGNNVEWLVANSVSINFLPIDTLALTVGATFINGWSYRNKDHRFGEDHNGVDPDSTVLGGGPHMGASIAYLVDVSYDVQPWLNLSVGLSTRSPQLNGESEYEIPFFNRYSKVYLNLTVSVDAAVEAIRGDASTSNRLLDEV